MSESPPLLEGRTIRLDPLSRLHLPGLCAVGLDEELWRITTSVARTPAEMEAYVAEALREREAGTALPFVTVERASGQIIGSTRFGNIDRRHRRAEIGWTWLARPWQRTAANTEAKYLMLGHAFDAWGLQRVEFKTDRLNERSRAALLRIGAREEGVLRRHMITWNGRVRDSVYFAILDEEWPAVKARLEQLLGERGPIPH